MKERVVDVKEKKVNVNINVVIRELNHCREWGDRYREKETARQKVDREREAVM
jgi:hypothetical protein